MRLERSQFTDFSTSQPETSRRHEPVTHTAYKTPANSQSSIPPKQPARHDFNIGANGSSWLEHAVFSPAANVLQTPYHAQTGHRARRDQVYAILNARIMRPTDPLPGIRGRRSDGIEPRLYVLARRGHRSRALWHVLHPVSPERVRPPFGLCGRRRSEELEYGRLYAFANASVRKVRLL